MNVLKAIAVGLTLLVPSCATGTDELRRSLPERLSSAPLAFRGMDGLPCQSLVFQLHEQEAEAIRREGLDWLQTHATDNAYLEWEETPGFTAVPDSRADFNLLHGLACLKKHPEYDELFYQLANGPGGYYAQSEQDGVVIVAPDQGLMFYSGYE